ncbi:MAG: Dyp-type peroxidase [Thermomonas sp.]
MNDTTLPNPQPFLQGNGLAICHMQLDFVEGVPRERLLERLGKLWDTALVGDDDPTAGGMFGHHLPPEYGAPSGSLVAGFRPEFWAKLDPGGVPANLAGFDRDIVGIDGSTAPATQRDLWLWINQSSADKLYDSIHKAQAALHGVARIAELRECFTYHNSVTLDGFADGLGNPNVFRAASVTVIPEGSPGAGGTTVLLQKWLVEVDRMRALTTREGEDVYGRSKLKGHQLSPLPPRSHIARNQFADGRGGTIDIVRRNAYFGDADEAGVMFVGFSNDIAVSMGMLKQMYGIGPDGIARTDALLDYSRAVSGAVYFVPSFDALARAGIRAVDQP